jgi:hypothetical protein
MMNNNIWHVYPQNDLQEHSLDSKKVTHFHEVEGYKIGTTVECNCKCEPRIMYEDGGVIIVHNSFDGREGIEWTNDILLTK